MKKKLLTFILTLSLWFVLAGHANIQVFLLGTIVCYIISLMFADNMFRLVQLKHGKKEYFLKIYYIFLVVSTFIYDIFVSAVRVSRHAFQVKPSFSPRIVRVKTSLENTNSIVILANFITLTQGALAVDLDILNKNYYIHWIDVYSDYDTEVKKSFINKHENLITKIFD